MAPPPGTAAAASGSQPIEIHVQLDLRTVLFAGAVLTAEFRHLLVGVRLQRPERCLIMISEYRNRGIKHPATTERFGDLALACRNLGTVARTAQSDCELHA
jgi:hypothetical protein